MDGCEGPHAADGRLMTYDSCSYPMFEQMRAPVKNHLGRKGELEW
jgi:hypothetical protein